jgi:hypothetical protein
MLKYTINRKNIIDKTIDIKFNIDSDINLLGQTDIIQKQFVEDEVLKSINKSLDYEKIIFKPCYINKITNELYLVDNVNYVLNNFTWSDNGFEYNDLFYLRNNFKFKNLRFDFYDNINSFTKNKIFNIFLYVDTSKSYDINSDIYFKRNKTIEGFNLYYFYNDINESNSVLLYNKISLQNAKTGRITNFKNTSDDLSFGDSYNNYFNLEYEFFVLNGVYYYTINSDNVTFIDNSLIINLYEI